MSAAVSKLRAAADGRLPAPEQARKPDDAEGAAKWLEEDYALSRSAAGQIAAYLAEGKRALGALPTRETLVLERFFDEAGGMQLVLHAPLGSRVNKAWGLALRKKFCQSFNFELQAAATDEALVLSLGPAHSFPLGEVFRYLNPKSVRETLVQAVLASPIFETRWRWTTTLALAVPRSRNGARLPAQIQRMIAEELLAAIVPDAAACQDNIQGAREVPEHPLVGQAMRDCLEQAMDLPQLVGTLERVFAGELTLLARDTPEPSVLCHEILNSAAYTFLDDAPLEERRTRAVYTRRATEARSADDLGALDPQAIARVREEAWPAAETADELHDALLLAGFVRAEEAAPHWRGPFDRLVASGRAHDAGGFWVPVERFDELNAVAPQETAPAMPERLRKSWTPEDAMRELVRGRMEVLGPMTARGLADSFGLEKTTLVDGALLALEGEGKVLRGRFTPEAEALEWCDRRLLARIHRYTLNRLRAEIEPVSAADFMRFLLHWQHVADEARLSGVEGLAAVIEQLDGFELAAGAWEQDVLPARVKDYAPEFIDRLCLSGRIAWGRITPAGGSGKAPLRSSPVALMPREHAALWRGADAGTVELGSDARAVHDALRSRGASFFHELLAATGLLRTQVERALGELAGSGLVTADSFSGLRALLAPSEKHRKRSRRRGSDVGVDTAGRWALLHGAAAADADARVEQTARVLLRRYGVVFRALLAREPRLPAWRELAAVYRRLEARGEIRGGRFVSGFGGEQFAMADAVGRLRAVRKQDRNGEWIALSAADPLNLVGIVTPEARVPGVTPNRVLLRDGLAIAALEAGGLRRLAASEYDDATLKSLFWPRSKAAGPDLRPLSPAARKRWLSQRLRVPLPG
jgi:ATP-dependent helicase Lhr and Lhr-like helicase